MQRKHNKDIVPTAKMLRKNMTKEEKYLWYDFLRTYPVRFSRQKVLVKYTADFYYSETKLIIELDRDIIRKKESNTMKKELLFLENPD